MLLLEGYTALDLTDLRGQFCGKALRDLGMEVIKVEPPGGDPVRRIGPFAHDRPSLESSLRFAYLNGGKKSLTLDLGHAEGRALLLRLVEQADVLVESYAPGELEQLGLGEAALRARNPRLVLTSVTAFGQTGPYRDYLGSDLVGLAMGGLMNISGDPALPPASATTSTCRRRRRSPVRSTSSAPSASTRRSCAATAASTSTWRRRTSSRPRTATSTCSSACRTGGSC